MESLRRIAAVVGLVASLTACGVPATEDMRVEDKYQVLLEDARSRYYANGCEFEMTHPLLQRDVLEREEQLAAEGRPTCRETIPANGSQETP